MAKKIDFPKINDPLFKVINNSFNLWVNRAAVKLKKIIEHESETFTDQRDREIFIEGAKTYYKRMLKMLPLTALSLLHSHLKDFYQQHDMDKNIESQIDELSMKDFLDQQKRRYLKYHLDRLDGQVPKLAEFLKTDITYAYKLLQKHKINLMEYTLKHKPYVDKKRDYIKRKTYFKRKRKFYGD